ncbi:MAG: sulfotransferase family 2 domain-containing protein [Gammaproteobacteria bacterium]
MIAQEHRFIFVHIPKTAGNALQSILVKYSEDSIVIRDGQDGFQRFAVEGPFGLAKHAALSDYLAVLGPWAFWSKKRFACVRNPWDRAISFYFSPHKGRVTWNRDEFIRLLAGIRPMVSYLRLPQDSSASAALGNVDFLLRFERLQQDFDRICDILGIGRHPIPLRNPSKHLPYPNYYDEELIGIVARRFSEDVSLLGYAFGDRPGMHG